MQAILYAGSRMEQINSENTQDRADENFDDMVFDHMVFSGWDDYLHRMMSSSMRCGGYGSWMMNRPKPPPYKANESWSL